MPGEKNRRRRQALIKADAVPVRGMTFEPKLVANSHCVFCGSRFGGRFLTICINCRSCQYCGLRVDVGDRCPFCGNTPDEHTGRAARRRIRATHGPQEPRKNKRRVTRRGGPRSRPGPAVLPD